MCIFDYVLNPCVLYGNKYFFIVIVIVIFIVALFSYQCIGVCYFLSDVSIQNELHYVSKHNI